MRKGDLGVGNEKAHMHRMVPIIRNFYQYVRPHKIKYFSAVAFLVIGMIMSSFQPYFFGKIIDNVSNGEVHDLIWNIAFMASTSLAGVVFSFFNKHLMSNVVFAIETDMSKKLMNNLYKLSLGKFSTTRKGEFISNFEEDIKALSTLSGSIISIVTGIGSGIVAFILLVRINLILALFMLIVLPPTLLFLKFKNNKVHSNERKVREENDIYLSFIHDLLSGFKTAKIFLAENFMNDKYLGLLEKLYDAKKSKALIQNFSSFILQVLNLTIYIAIVFIGTQQIMSGLLTLGGLVSFNIYSKIFMNSMQSILTVNFQLHEIAVSLERILDRINYDEVNMCEGLGLNRESNEQHYDFKKDIVFTNVSYMYNESRQYILDNVTFSIPANQATALVGVSGAGKTTILNLIMGLIRDYKGEILIGSSDYRHINEKDIFSNISFVTQDNFLFSFTIKENLLLSNTSATEEEIMDACRKAHIHDFISTLPEGYDTKLGDKGFNLSGGQIQRISIARAILKKSQIYIFDEMTSSLDKESEQYIKNIIKALAKSYTVVVASHKVSTIDGLDHIILLKKGNVFVDKVQGVEKIENV